MRYCIQPATSTDVAFLAMTINPDASDAGHGSDNEQTHRLLRTCANSTQVWAVRDQNGVPHALWGVSPKEDDAEVGCMWLLACEDLEGAPEDFRALTGMVLGEMFSQYARLENYVDAGKDRALDLLRQVGFTVEAATTPFGSEQSLHQVWMEADDSRSVMGAERPRYLN